MWNDSLKIGVENIDRQHETLFAKVDELIDEMIDLNNGECQRDKIISTILFLKDYAVTHFADEEAYQLSISDPRYEKHKKQHESFIATVLKHEAKLVASDFAHNDVSKFTSTLLAWLIHHVSDVDQKIGKAVEDAGEAGHADIIRECFCNVIGNMIDADKDSIVKVREHNESFDGAITVRHTFTHVIEGCAVFDFSVPFIKALIRSVSNMTPDEIGDFEKTFVLQTSTMAIEDIYRRLDVDEYAINDVEISVVGKEEPRPDERTAFDTGSGIVEIGLAIT